ncbi:MAG TPA: hypothetical protein VGN63_15325 [Flavisolibacter sp.]|jgi:hypothetical protein|nr:hypothetical protein [Flavisolibacter sp.]
MKCSKLHESVRDRRIRLRISGALGKEKLTHLTRFAAIRLLIPMLLLFSFFYSREDFVELFRMVERPDNCTQ